MQFWLNVIEIVATVWAVVWFTLYFIGVIK